MHGGPPPIKKTGMNTYIKNQKVSALDTCHTPLTLKFSDGTHLSIHEAL